MPDDHTQRPAIDTAAGIDFGGSSAVDACTISGGSYQALHRRFIAPWGWCYLPRDFAHRADDA